MKRLTSLWTPPQARTLPRAQVPTEDVRLADTRVLALDGPALTVPGGTLFRCGDGMTVIASLDERRHGKLLHVSASYPHRDPTWGDLVKVKQAFFGDLDAMMVMPRLGDYINLHAHCLHVFQTPIGWGIR